MKVSELIKALQKLDPDLEVYMSVDDEGNSYRRLEIEPETGRIDPRDFNYSQVEEFYFDAWSDDECCLEPDERKSFIRAVCL
jgi:hypothetical protein